MMASVNYFLNKFKKEDFMVCIYIYKIHDWNIWPYFIDVSVDIPDDLDITPLRGSGLQPGEEELPSEQQPTQGIFNCHLYFLW